jgi:hypothetical protein
MRGERCIGPGLKAAPCTSLGVLTGSTYSNFNLIKIFNAVVIVRRFEIYAPDAYFAVVCLKCRKNQYGNHRPSFVRSCYNAITLSRGSP